MDRAPPDATRQVKEDMLLRHYFEGLPKAIAQQLTSTSNITTVDAARLILDYYLHDCIHYNYKLCENK